MQKKITLRITPTESMSDDVVKGYIAAAEGVDPSAVSGFYTLRRSIDARSRNILVNLSVMASIHEPFRPRPLEPLRSRDVQRSPRRVAIIGTGPAGLFAALELLEQGIKPILLERGKDVRERRRDLALLNREGILNPDSNYCFGEGGAGTYSDGKLYTRSNKRGDVDRILSLLVQFGADERILYESHPHIGTNKLPGIISAIRDHIRACGGEVHFSETVTDLEQKDGKVQSLLTASGNRIEAGAFILATGHSARDIFRLLQRRNILIQSKPFALGVRVEHPQELVDSIQYKCSLRDPSLPPASYSLVHQVQGKGVFSFCMCPGGIIAPASTSEGSLVVNGWSPSRRNNPYANSGMVVEVGMGDLFDSRTRTFFPSLKPDADDPLALMTFQNLVEESAYRAGGGRFTAPAQRLTDLTAGRLSTTLPACSYRPGVNSADLSQVLPPFIHERLREGFIAFGRKMRGYLSHEAIVVATESRTSSPVRIPRNDDLQHPQVSNLYPCGEGAGYAGGIVSAAMDGQKVALALSRSYK